MRIQRRQRFISGCTACVDGSAGTPYRGTKENRTCDQYRYISGISGCRTLGKAVPENDGTGGKGRGATHCAASADPSNPEHLLGESDRTRLSLPSRQLPLVHRPSKNRCIKPIHKIHTSCRKRGYTGTRLPQGGKCDQTPRSGRLRKETIQRKLKSQWLLPEHLRVHAY